MTAATGVQPSKTNALNVGAGPAPNTTTAFLWVDRGAWPVDICADARALPFRDSQFTFIHCAHLIEHVPYDDALGLLTELRRVLKRDGVMYIAAPDLDRATAARSNEWISYTLTGGWRPGWEHLWSCSTSKLRLLLVDAGFAPTWAAKIPPYWPQNSHSWPVDFEARFLCRRDDFPWPRSFPAGMEIVL